MGKYRKILVAVDGSQASVNAFRQACKIGRGYGSPITVIMSLPLYQDQFDVLSTKEKVGDSLRIEGDRVLSAIRTAATEENVSITEILEEGSPFKAITDIADDSGYDLIVMGRRGMTHLERALMGSVTARVIGHTKKDVLVVPENASLRWGTILLATDGSAHSSSAVDGAINCAGSYNGALSIVHVIDVTEEFQACAPDAVDKMILQAKKNIDEIKVRAGESRVDAEVFVREGKTYEVITGLASQLNAGAIIMGSHGRTGLMRLFMGSVTAMVIGHAQCPIMVIKSKE